MKYKVREPRDISWRIVLFIFCFQGQNQPYSHYGSIANVELSPSIKHFLIVWAMVDVGVIFQQLMVWTIWPFMLGNWRCCWCLKLILSEDFINCYLWAKSNLNYCRSWQDTEVQSLVFLLNKVKSGPFRKQISWVNTVHHRQCGIDYPHPRGIQAGFCHCLLVQEILAAVTGATLRLIMTKSPYCVQWNL